MCRRSKEPLCRDQRGFLCAAVIAASSEIWQLIERIVHPGEQNVVGGHLLECGTDIKKGPRRARELARSSDQVQHRLLKELRNRDFRHNNATITCWHSQEKGTTIPAVRSNKRYL